METRRILTVLKINDLDKVCGKYVQSLLWQYYNNVKKVVLMLLQLTLNMFLPIGGAFLGYNKNFVSSVLKKTSFTHRVIFGNFPSLT